MTLALTSEDCLEDLPGPDETGNLRAIAMATGGRQALLLRGRPAFHPRPATTVQCVAKTDAVRLGEPTFWLMRSESISVFKIKCNLFCFLPVSFCRLGFFACLRVRFGVLL